MNTVIHLCAKGRLGGMLVCAVLFFFFNIIIPSSLLFIRIHSSYSNIGSPGTNQLTSTRPAPNLAPVFPRPLPQAHFRPVPLAGSLRSLNHHGLNIGSHSPASVSGRFPSSYVNANDHPLVRHPSNYVRVQDMVAPAKSDSLILVGADVDNADESVHGRSTESGSSYVPRLGMAAKIDGFWSIASKTEPGGNERGCRMTGDEGDVTPTRASSHPFIAQSQIRTPSRIRSQSHASQAQGRSRRQFPVLQSGTNQPNRTPSTRRRRKRRHDARIPQNVSGHDSLFSSPSAPTPTPTREASRNRYRGKPARYAGQARSSLHHHQSPNPHMANSIPDPRYPPAGDDFCGPDTLPTPSRPFKPEPVLKPEGDSSSRIQTIGAGNNNKYAYADGDHAEGMPTRWKKGNYERDFAGCLCAVDFAPQAQEEENHLKCSDEEHQEQLMLNPEDEGDVLKYADEPEEKKNDDDETAGIDNVEWALSSGLYEDVFPNEYRYEDDPSRDDEGENTYYGEHIPMGKIQPSPPIQSLSPLRRSCSSSSSHHAQRSSTYNSQNDDSGYAYTPPNAAAFASQPRNESVNAVENPFYRFNGFRPGLTRAHSTADVGRGVVGSVLSFL
jgi:hypothetical protein